MFQSYVHGKTNVQLSMTQRDTRDLLIGLSIIVIFQTFEKVFYLKNNMASGTK